jgi:hypothetical protein
MKTQTTLFVTAVVLIAAAGTTAIALGVNDRDGLPELPANPFAEQVELVEAHPFQLSTPATHTFRAEQPSYTSGLVLVLRTRPDLLVPRQTYEPVLYVGNETAERVNIGAESGHLVVIVPGADFESLEDSPIFFGTPELPERVTRDVANAELATARAVGAQPAANVSLAERDALVLTDAYELQLFASTLIETYSPSEFDLITGLRAPLLRR